MVSKASGHLLYYPVPEKDAGSSLTERLSHIFWPSHYWLLQIDGLSRIFIKSNYNKRKRRKRKLNLSYNYSRIPTKFKKKNLLNIKICPSVKLISQQLSSTERKIANINTLHATQVSKGEKAMATFQINFIQLLRVNQLISLFSS